MKNRHAALLIALFGEQTDNLLDIFDMWQKLGSNDFDNVINSIVDDGEYYDPSSLIQSMLLDMINSLSEDILDLGHEDVYEYIMKRSFCISHCQKSQTYETDWDALNEYEPINTRAEVTQKMILGVKSLIHHDKIIKTCKA